jgi:hypothetical protein
VVLAEAVSVPEEAVPLAAVLYWVGGSGPALGGGHGGMIDSALGAYKCRVLDRILTGERILVII